jgi:integrase
VFPGERGGMLRHGNFYFRHFKPAVVRPLPEELHELRFHDLRHTCASLLIQRGIHPLSISRHLGHSSIQITMDRYGHIFPDDQDKLARALDAMYEGAAP